MKRFVSAIVLFLVLVSLVACTTVSPGSGFGTNDVISGASMEKTGEASGTFLFGMIPLASSADISMKTAAQNAGITKIATVDTKYFSILGIIVVRTTIVTGE